MSFSAGGGSHPAAKPSDFSASTLSFSNSSALARSYDGQHGDIRGCDDGFRSRLNDITKVLFGFFRTFSVVKVSLSLVIPGEDEDGSRPPLAQAARV